MRRNLFPVLVIVLLPLPAWGQAVPSREPTSTHIFPAGGQRGTTVQVRVGGECLPPGMAFKFAGAGVIGPGVLGAEAKPRYEPSAHRPPRDADGAGAACADPREWESCKLTLDRTTNFIGPADVELIAPPGFTAAKVQIKDGQVEAVIRVAVDGAVKRPGDLVLTFRATGRLPSGGTVVTDATVPVTVRDK